MTVGNTQTGGVLVLGCSDGTANAGLEADEKAVTALEIPVTTVSTGAARRNGENHVEVVAAPPSLLLNQINEAIQKRDCKVIKIGALFSDESVKIVSDILRQNIQLKSVIDIEPFFKTGPAPNHELITALLKDILPSINILSATVPEVKALLDEAGIPTNHPNSIRDVSLMGNKLRTLGPEYVIIKREIFDGEDQTTTLHFVLCGSTEPILVTSRCENPKGVFGTSYSIPPAIAAYLSTGHTGPEAVAAGFKFVEEMLKRGQYFE